MKYCSKCGNANIDEAVFCAGCGSPLAQAPAAPQPSTPAPAPVAAPAAPAPAPEKPAYSAPAQPSYAAPAYDAGYTGPDVQTKNTSTLWMILNIAATLLCCPGALFSIIGLIFAIMGSGSFNKGNYEDMAKKTKLSTVLFIVAAVLGLLGWILGIVIWIVYANNH
jgi:hypothetical protein